MKSTAFLSSTHRSAALTGNIQILQSFTYADFNPRSSKLVWQQWFNFPDDGILTDTGTSYLKVPYVAFRGIYWQNIFVAAVSDLASAAGDWQSVSSRGRPYKSSHFRVEEKRVSRGAGLRSAECCVLRIKYSTKPLGAWLILGAGGGNPRVTAWNLLQYYYEVCFLSFLITGK